jgi:putative transposase
MTMFNTGDINMVMTTNKVSEIALFRLSVLGALTSRIDLDRGEVRELILQQSVNHYDIPNSTRIKVSFKTIESWYYRWKKYGVQGLEPKQRLDYGVTRLSSDVQEEILSLKSDHMGRSVNVITNTLAKRGFIGLSRSSVYRFLKSKGLSGRVISDAPTIERRKFEAEHVNDIWYGDVMHGPSILIEGKLKKTYMVSLMDDASRLVVHSFFSFNEQAESIEYALQQALLKRGLPKRLIVDNGPAYISKSLKSICAKLGIHLIYCRPYEPEGKGKLERWHRTVRDQFIKELNMEIILTRYDLNKRLWGWLEEYYHQTPHRGLNGLSPLQRYRQELDLVQGLGALVNDLEKIFFHRVMRTINKDASFSLDGKYYEVPYELAGCKVQIAITPSERVPKLIEDNDGNELGVISEQDPKKNLYRKRQRPIVLTGKKSNKSLVDELVTQRQERLVIKEDE